MKFSIFGHKNVLSLHKNTLEFTKDQDLTLQGDCIVGVNSNFNYDQLMEFIKTKLKENTSKVNLFFYYNDKELDSLDFQLNPNFNNKHEIVLRKSDFDSDRTLGFFVSKGSYDLNREMINLLKQENTEIIIELK